MAKSRKVSPPATLGFRVKSGWASVVLLGGTTRLPSVLWSRTVLLSDPAEPETRQPYHATFGELEENKAKLKGRVRIVRRAAKQSVSLLLNQLRREGLRVRKAGLVVGSLIQPESIGNPHIRAHAFEGQLFRTALLAALRLQEVRSFVFLERNVVALAVHVLHTPEKKVKGLLTDVGRSQKPWSANEKLAALAALLVLARSR
ncbi:MAG: hypothetical protein HY562_08115 [Ignavibacteriales bacterium]|nr:hypothetical protein [Ignavibacteriales bacterium]